MFQVAVRAHLCSVKYLSSQVPYAFTLMSPLIEPLLICQRTQSDVYILRIASFSIYFSKLVNFQAVRFLCFREGFLKCFRNMTNSRFMHIISGKSKYNNYKGDSAYNISSEMFQ